MRKFLIIVLGLLISSSGVIFAAGTADSGSSSEQAARTGKYGEAPMLAALVASGDLPAVDERLPENPAVRTPIDQVGKYGGTIRVFALDNWPWQDMTESVERGPYMLKTVDGKLLPDVAESATMASDNTSITIKLRKGHKWSDGAPVTADDVVFQFNSMHNHPDVVTYKKSPFVTEAVKIDDQTVQLVFDGTPHPEMMIKLATWHGGDWEMLKPKHYLSKWHIDFNSKANEVAKEEGHESWQQAFTAHFFWKPSSDVNLPTIQAWNFKEITPTVRVYERNPYYFRVDTDGNQLPYVDQIISTVVEKEVYNLKIISGEANLAYGNTSVDNYALYKENEADGNYNVTMVPGLSVSEIAIVFNQNHEQPWRAELYQDIRFRQAMSLAINREEVNEQVYFGLATPRQAAFPPVHSYHKPEWDTAYADYDPAQANKLLDEIGMTSRSRDNFRKAPGGEELQVLVEYAEGTPVAGMELIKEYWEAVGVKTLIKVQTGQARNVTRTLNEHDVRASAIGEASESGVYTTGGGEQFTCNRSRGVTADSRWMPCGTDNGWGWQWGKWLAANAAIKAGTHTLADFGGSMPGWEPPQEVKDLDEWSWAVRVTEFGSPEHVRLATNIGDLQAEKLWAIGVVGLSPTVYISSKDIANTPSEYSIGVDWPVALNYWGDQLFYK